MPVIEPPRPTLARLTVDRDPEHQLVTAPRGGVITTATPRDATGTALTWMADAGVGLHLLQRIAGHQDPAVTSRYLHPDGQAVLSVGTAFSRRWSASSSQASRHLEAIEGGQAES